MPDFIDLPQKPVFNCADSSFAVLDADQVKRNISAPPLLKLNVGAGNLFEQHPLRVTERAEEVVVVLCEGGVSVRLDFEDDVAAKSGPNGKFRYRGGIGDGNSGLGFLPA